MIIRSGALRDRNHLILSEHRAAWFLQLSSVSYYRIHYQEGENNLDLKNTQKGCFLHPRNTGGICVRIWRQKSIKTPYGFDLELKQKKKNRNWLNTSSTGRTLTFYAINSQWQSGNEALYTESHLPLCTMTQWRSTDLWKTHKTLPLSFYVRKVVSIKEPLGAGTRDVVKTHFLSISLHRFTVNGYLKGMVSK